MKLHYFPGFDGRWNFGDVLNPWLWDRVLPGVLDEDDSAVFIGIGTLLNEHVPPARTTVVFGAGSGYGEVPERASDWTVYCVRGPLTAQALKLEPAKAVTDPGALAAHLYGESFPSDKCRARAYMPHIANANPLLEGVCQTLDLFYIDPTWPVERVFDAIASSEVLVTEALHGAICADALRVPWVPIRSADSVFEFKWRDWLASLQLEYQPSRVLRPLQLTGRGGRHADLLRSLSCHVNRHSLSRAIRRAKPVLSDETVLEDRLAALERCLDELRQDVANGKFR